MNLSHVNLETSGIYAYNPDERSIITYGFYATSRLVGIQVPEPAKILLVGLGLTGLLAFRRWGGGNGNVL